MLEVSPHTPGSIITRDTRFPFTFRELKLNIQIFGAQFLREGFNRNRPLLKKYEPQNF